MAALLSCALRNAVELLQQPRTQGTREKAKKIQLAGSARFEI
jgi:hypothetical protein